MDQKASNCLVHNKLGSPLICTFKDCKHPSRYLCEKCLKDNTHKHKQQNQNHLINLIELCGEILHMIEQYKRDYEFYSDVFHKMSQIQESSLQKTHNFDDSQNEKYEYICYIKKRMLRELFQDIKMNLTVASKQFICIKCFNSIKHDHNQILTLFELKLFIELSNKDQYLPRYQNIQKTLKPWINEKPIYNQAFIDQIELSIQESKISKQQLEKLIFLKNRTFDVSDLQNLLEKIIDKSLISLNKKIEESMQLEFCQTEPSSEKPIFDIKNQSAFFHIVPNEEQYIVQNQNHVLKIHNRASNKLVHKVYLRSKILVYQFTQNMKYLFLGDDCGFLICSKYKYYQQIFKQKIHKLEIEAIHPISDSQVITCSKDGFIKVTNIRTKKIIVRIFISPVSFTKYKECQIEYNKQNDTIVIARDSLYVLKRHLARIVTETNQVFEMYDLQLVDKNLILSANWYKLLLWKYDGEQQKLLLIQSYEVKLIRFRYVPENKMIIVMGRCFIEILDINFRRIKLGINNCSVSEDQCHPKRIQQFQIEQQNSLYSVIIFDDTWINLIQGTVLVQRKKMNLDIKKYIKQ